MYTISVKKRFPNLFVAIKQYSIAIRKVFLFLVEIIYYAGGVSIMYCRKCGTKLPDDALYCINCGAKVAENTNIDNKNVNNNNMNEGDSKSNNAIYIIALIVIVIIMLTSGYNVIFNTMGLCILKFGWDYGKKAFKSHEWMKLVGIIVCCLMGFCIIAVGKQM